MQRTAFPPSRLLLLPVLVALSLTGCATKEFVQQEVALVNQRIVDLENTLGHADKRIKASAARIEATEARIGKAETEAVALNKRLDATQADLAGANQNVAGLLVGLNAAGQRIDANAATIASTQQRLTGVEEQLGATGQRVEAALASLTRTDGRLGALESALRVAAPPAETTAPATPVAAAAAAPATAPAAPVPAAGTADLQERLARVGGLIDEVHRRINVNTSTLQTANQRIGELESGLAAAGKRGEETDTALKATQEKVAAAQGQMEAAEQRISANTHALERMGPKVDAAEAGLKIASTRLDEAEKRLGGLGEQLARNDAADAAISATAKEALERAQAASKLVEGRLLAETVLSEEVGFGFDKAALNEASRQALTAFAEKLKAENQAVYIEVQGHTDNSGPAEANLRLSRQRAETVRDFLNREAGIPLHRLAVAAYGETRPVADNKTREGRSKNRRVVLVVLK
jgi:outer membrane protein OmpA-like peptidoglycan-associated protein